MADISQRSSTCLKPRNDVTEVALDAGSIAVGAATSAKLGFERRTDELLISERPITIDAGSFKLIMLRGSRREPFRLRRSLLILHKVRGASLFAVLVCGVTALALSTPRTLANHPEAALGAFVSSGIGLAQMRPAAMENAEAARQTLLKDLQTGKLAEALEIGRDAVARWPKDSELLHLLGIAYFKTKQDASAISELQSAENLDPRDPNVPFDLALVYLDQNQDRLAANELEKATRLNPDNALAHVLLGRAYLNTNRTLPAIDQFKTALRIDTSTPLGYYHLGFAYASLGRDKEAIEEYRKELVRSPQNPQVLYQLGHCLLDTGDYAEAGRYLQKTTEVNPRDSEAFYDLGKALLAQGNFTSAMPALQQAVALSPTDPAPHYQLARALEGLGQHDKAQEERLRFVELKQAQSQTGGMASGRSQ